MTKQIERKLWLEREIDLLYNKLLFYEDPVKEALLAQMNKEILENDTN